MSVQTIYRIGIWLPLAVPALVAGIVHGLGVTVETFPLRTLVQVLLMSLLYGGVPYALLALWATWWIGGRSEADIQRLMIRAPFLMVGVFVPMAVLAGIVVGQPRIFLAVAVLGAVVTIPVGYGYVGLVALLRRSVGPVAHG
jgi:hypothetical protein